MSINIIVHLYLNLSSEVLGENIGLKFFEYIVIKDLKNKG